MRGRPFCDLARAMLLASALACSWAWAQLAVPPLQARVTDLTGTLTPAQIESLTTRLDALEAQRGSQLAVLMLPTTAPESIEQFALRVAEAWALGRAAIDDGVLLLVAKNDRAMRIEVGYGLEGAIPDALANRIMDERIAPRFAEGDFAGGLTAGVDALIALIEGEPLPEPAAREPSGFRDTELLPLLIFAAAVLAPIARRRLGPLPGATALGTAAGLIVWFSAGTLLLAILVGAMAFMFALGGTGGPRGWYTRGGRGGFGGMPRSPGGFSGGGGRFGGGGASGRW